MGIYDDRLGDGGLLGGETTPDVTEPSEPAEHGEPAGRPDDVASPLPLSMPPFAPLGAKVEEPAGGPAQGLVDGLQEGAPPAGGQPPYTPPHGYGWPPGGLPPAVPTAPRGDEPAASPSPRRAVAVLGVVALLAAGLGAGVSAAVGGTGAPGATSSASPSTPGRPPGALSSTPKLSMPAIVAAVEPAVVDIETNVASPVGQASSAAGTGMIVTPSGQVLTNNHVVENATSIRVVVPGHPGTYPVKVIGVNPTKDVALLQIEGLSHLPYVRLGNSATVALGDSVVAVGNALGLGGTPSVVTGQVSAIGRTITASDPGLRPETLHNLIQTSAQIQPGDSGGPLLDATGKVIGMDTAAASADTGTSVGFAIPVNEARTIIDQMRHRRAVGGNILGASPFLGVYELTSGGPGGSFGNPFGGLPGFGTSGTSGSPAVQGVTLGGVAAASPAEQAGLQAGDVITSIDGTATPTWAALVKVVQARKPGDSVTIDFVDPSGTSRTATVTLAALPR